MRVAKIVLKAGCLMMMLFLATFFMDMSREKVCASGIETIADGIYSIDGVLRRATTSQNSMGNNAIQKPMELWIENGKATLRMELVAINTDSGTTKITSYLAEFRYFPDWNGGSSGNALPKEKTPITADVKTYYDGIYDRYNDPDKGVDANIKGKLYPHYITIPVEMYKNVIWTQIYVPVMEELMTGNGMQYARLELDWNSLKRTGNLTDNSTDQTTEAEKEIDKTTEKITEARKNTDKTTNKTAEKTVGLEAASNDRKLDVNSLSNGTYVLNGQMYKTDRKTLSMANDAINTRVKLTVKKKKYYLTLYFKGMKINTQAGYLGKISYYKTGYQTDSEGMPTGSLKAVKIDNYQKDSKGKKLKDGFGTNYPEQVTFPMIKEAKEDGWVPLQVFVPIMDSISKGSGTQNMYLKLDFSTLEVATKDSFKDTKTTSASEKNSTVTHSAASAKSKGDYVESSALAAGHVYTCKINPSYIHPVTGQIEDAGGTSSAVTGQGMVEGCIDSKGIMEITENGEYYLSFCMGLADYTSKYEFSVQEANDSGWSKVSATVTGSGQNSSGTTTNMRVKIPTENSIVRCSMYVESMGRNVIFYFYPSDYSMGNQTDLKAEMVTEDSSAAIDAGILENTESESTTALSDISEDSLRDAQGLSLSTASESEEENEKKVSASLNIVQIAVAVCVGMTGSGLILLLAGAYLVYYCRKNWEKWGGRQTQLPIEKQELERGDVFLAEGFGKPDEENGIWDSEGVVREEEKPDAQLVDTREEENEDM